MDEKVVNKIMSEVLSKIETIDSVESKEPNVKFTGVNMTEFVGASPIGDTIGLVIANVDSELHKLLQIDAKYRSIGIIGARTGAGPHIMAADDAIKATSAEILKIELARDTKGGAGHGNLIIFGAEDVSDTRRAVEVTLRELERTFGDVYGNEAGHIELQCTARASYALNKAFNAPLGKAFGLMVGAPAAIGVVMADVALKSANVEVVGYSSPASGTCFSNEVILTVAGDSGAVRQAIIAAREAGIALLGSLGSKPTNNFPSYI